MRHRVLPLCALLGLLFIGLPPNLNAQDDCAHGLGADVYFLVDTSWSMGEENFEHVRHFLLSTIRALYTTGGDSFRFALVQYNSKPKTEFKLNTYQSTQGALSHIQAMSYHGGGTRTGLGLDFLIQAHLTTASGSRAPNGVSQVVVVLTDGRSQDDVSEPARVLRMAEVKVFAVGVQDALDSELREMASEPYDTHVFSVDSFLALKDIIQDLVVGLCGAVTQNWGPSVVNEEPVPEGGTAQDSADLVLLIDGSQNVGAANFPFVRDLALRIIERLDVARDKIHVALALYNGNPDIKFYLNSYESKASVLEAVKGLSYPGGDESNLGAALEEVAESLLSSNAGGRAEEGVPQMLVVISGSSSTDDTGIGDRALKRAGVITFGVAIGSSASADLQTVATDGSFVLSAPDFRAAPNLAGQLLPYLSGVVQRTIIVQTEFTEALVVGQRDIIFLLDSTMGGTLINSTREFIKRFVNNMPIGPDQVQVGIAQFSTSARAEMDLNTHGSKESLVASLARLRARPGQTVNIGAALDYVRTNMLRPDKGSRLRQGVPQLILLMTTKKSSDRVDEAARALQQMGVLTLAAGSKTADEDELKRIAFAESMVFMLRDFRILLRNPRMIVDALSSLSGTVVTEGPTETVVEITTVQTQKVIRDFVFLVDGSSFVGAANFPYVRDLIINIVNQLDVRPDRVQIGLLQYAEDPKIEFYLNSYSSREDVVNKINQLSLLGGSVLNTGKALDYALKNMFKPSTGSRRRQGVQQVLVLITGGPTQDQIKAVADQLALAGVLTFTVGSGQADVNMLRSVAFVPDLAYHETYFSNLPALSEQMLIKLTTVVGDTDTITTFPGEIEGRDVAFLIDGTDNVRSDFAYIQDFIIKVIEPLEISADKVRVAVVQHSERPTPSFFLSTYQTKDDVIRAINNMRVVGGRGLNTGAALQYMKDTVMSERQGSRAAKGIPQFLIVLSGSRSRDSVKESAGALKIGGVVPFGVGVRDADARQMETISHNPSFAFKVRDFSELNTVPGRLNTYVNMPKEELQVVLQQVHTLGAAKKDIVFLVDGSDNTKNGFPQIQQFVKSIVERLSIDDGEDRVAFVQYADAPTVDFHLSTYKKKSNLMGAIDKLRHIGGTDVNTGAAMRFTRLMVFTSSWGSRRLEGVPQILVVLTSQPSDDNIKMPAFALKEHEIITVGVGVGDADLLELETIAFKPDMVSKVNDYAMLSQIHSQVLPTLDLKKDTKETFNGISDLVAIREFIRRMVEDIEDEVVRVAVVQYSNDVKTYFDLNSHKTKNILSVQLEIATFIQDEVHSYIPTVELESAQRDIVFLLDGSDETLGMFPAMQGFVQGVVESLNVGENTDRVSVVQYSDEPETEISLNTYFDKQDVLDTVQNMIHMGDETLTEFDTMLGFVKTIIQSVNVQRSNDRVALVQYSSEPSVNFYLNSHQTLDTVAEAVQNVRHKGGRARNTGKAIQFVKDNVFTASSGSRHQMAVPQVLVLITGGRSSDDFRNAVANLKAMGVIVFVLGIEKADVLEIQAISHKPEYAVIVTDPIERSGIEQLIMSTKQRVEAPALRPPLIAHAPKFALSIDDYEEIAGVRQQTLSLMNEPSVQPITPTKVIDQKKSDVVFLIDGSSDSKNGFEQIRSLIETMVENMNLDDDQDQVAVVQYNRDPTANFYLNSYSSKNDVLNSIRTMRHKLGRQLNIGKALEFVRNNVFATVVGDMPSFRLSELPTADIVFLLDGSKDMLPTELHFTRLLTILYLLGSRPIMKRDVVFLIDGSDDVRNKFSSMRDFVAKVVYTFDIDKGKDRVAVVQYSNKAEQSFNLNAYTTREDVLRNIANLKPKGGRPQYIGAALQHVIDKVLVTGAGSRKNEGAKQILIILAGGRSRDSPRGPANALKAAGVEMFALGSKTANSLEMEMIASNPNYTYSIPDFVNLPLTLQSLVSHISQFEEEEDIKTGTRQQAGKDVVFLLDGSDGTRNEFPAMQTFVQTMVERLNVDDNSDRVSVVQYSRDPAVQFYLNTYSTKRDILGTIRGLRHKGGRPLNTGAALQYLRDNVFTASAGSRRQEGVPQLLILLSGGRSFDSVDAPASALKQMGVVTFAIGTRNTDPREMQKISHEPSYAISVSDFKDLPNVQQQLQSSVETVIVEAAPESPIAPVDSANKDIVFLLDDSDATRNGFPAMLAFVEKVVQKREIGENTDRVSVVQYSRDAEVSFYLNTYDTRDDVLDAVRGLRHRGGRTINTGAALQYVSDNVFTDSAGSRRRQGVPQMLVLLNGGRSNDNAQTPATALRDKGIIVLGIGAGRAAGAEMQNIVYNSSYAVSVSDFSDLPNLQEQLSSVMGTTGEQVTPLTPNVTVVRQQAGKDVVFLLDGSDGTRNEFPAMQTFVQTMVERLNVDDNSDRVSVVQYSRDPAVQFYLNTYSTKRDILGTIRGLRHKGGRPLNTGAALQYLRDNVFTASAGSRRQEGVPQLLILLSGGRSFDSVDAPASALKQMGVVTFAIGTRNTDPREMQKISHEPSYAISVSDFKDLPNVQQQLQSSVETVIVEAAPESPIAPVDSANKDIVFLLDDSDATRNGFPAMLAFVEKVVQKREIGENTDRVSVVQYSRDAEVSFYLNTYDTRDDVLDAVRGLRHRGGRTINTGAALQYVSDNVFTDSAGSRRRQGVPQMLVLLNGGRSNDNAQTPATALRDKGIIVLGIGAGRAAGAEMQNIVYNSSYAVSVSDFSDLPNLQEQLSSVMGTTGEQVTPLTPNVTVVRQQAGKDVVFLLDGSDGTRNEFPAMQTFVQTMVERLNVDDNSDRVSVVQYSRDPAVQFYLNTYSTKRDILGTIRGLRHKGGRPLNTGAALQYLRDNVFTASAGSRRQEGVPQLLILLSGGRSFDSVDAPASALKQMGVVTFAIGTRNTDPREMQKISHEPSYAISVSDFKDLPNVQQQLQSSVETVIVEAAPESPIAPVDSANKDIVFLLDDSDATRNGFPAMLAFVEKVVQKRDIGENTDRVSVVQYSRDAEVSFYLNTYDTRDDVLDAVRGLRHRGGRTINTGAALQYVSDNVFTDSAGSRRRQGVPQMLVLLNGGRSNDNAQTPATALRDKGIIVLGIGAGRAAGAEMQNIVYNSSYAVSVSDFSDLPNLQEQLSSVMGTTGEQVTPLTPNVTVVRQQAGKDVVFLLDGSDGTRNEFPAMQTFVQTMVERLNVDDNSDRVSVVQYSRDPAVQFYLNTYSTKRDILGTIRGLRHKGGRPLNTGAALQYLRDNVFTASAGSRRQEGVPQLLILLSGGRSFDSVDAPASALKQMGVVTFAIGTRNTDPREMQKISHEPSYAISVSDFKDLPNVQQQLQSSVETVIVEAAPESPIAPVDSANKDIVFLLDDSDATRNGFPAMLAFVEKVVQKRDIGENTDRVSVVQYSRDAEVSFYLNTYDTRDDVLDAVRGLRHRGGRTINTGAALQYVSDNVFTDSAGSRRRQGVPQMLVLLNGGRSNDNAQTPATALRDKGIIVLGIGAGRAAGAEMQNIVYNSSYAVSVSDFSDLPNLQEQLSSVMGTTGEQVTPLTPNVTGKNVTQFCFTVT
ncbi:collagen alpha-3(VI) chain-like [Eucyclogobius newberryi]|uniref:collagen alpha-3(VI) chain-like n=1 Tax=Eucyclogobius newberryi TaxID=166745 RepID=UPI003B5C479B